MQRREVLLLKLVKAAPGRLIPGDLGPLDPPAVGVGEEVLAGRAAWCRSSRGRGERPAAGRMPARRGARERGGRPGAGHRASGTSGLRFGSRDLRTADGGVSGRGRLRFPRGRLGAHGRRWRAARRPPRDSALRRRRRCRCDIPEHAGRYTFRPCSASPSPSSGPAKGAYEENLCRLGELFREVAAGEPPPELVVAPETALTGYFLEGGVRDLARHRRAAVRRPDAVSTATPGPAARRRHRLLRGPSRTGSTTPRCTPRSAAPTPASGTSTARSSCRPTACSTRSGSSSRAGRVQAFDTRWGRAAMLVCEDAWHSFTPMLAALDGAQLIIVPSASPARGVGARATEAPGRPGSLARWERLVQDIAGEHGVYVALAQLVGFEGGKAFPGGSLVAGPRGDAARARRRSSRRRCVPATLDLEEITRARADLPLLADLEMRLPHLLGVAARARRRSGGQRRRTAGRAGAARAGSDARRPTRRPARRPPVASAIRSPSMPTLTRRWLVEFIRDEVQRRRGFEQVVIGLSGGVDSSLVAYLAAEALGPEQRARRPDALSHLEPREPGARAARDRRARHPRPHGRHQRGGGRARGRDRRARRSRPAGQHDGADADDHAVRPLGRATARSRSAPATRPSGCSATSPGTPTTRRR